MKLNDDENIPIQQSNNVQQFLMTMNIINKTANCDKEKCQYKAIKLRTKRTK